MAAEACVAGYKTLIDKLERGTESLLGERKQMLPSQYYSIMKAIVALSNPTALLPDWHLVEHDTEAEAAARSVMKEHCTCIRSCATFVQTVLALMHSIAPDPDSHSILQATQDLFSIVFIPMSIVTELPASWPTGGYLLRNPLLYSALSALTAYCLSQKPSGQAGYPSWGTSIKEQCVWNPALLLLHTTVTCLQPPSHIIDYDTIAALPPGLTNNLCCLACEELGLYLCNQESLLASRSEWAYLSMLLSMVTHCVQHAHCAAESWRRCTALLGPGVLEASKMVLIVHCSTAFQGLPEGERCRAGLVMEDLHYWCGSLAFTNDPAEQSMNPMFAAQGKDTAHAWLAFRANRGRACNRLAANLLASSSSNSSSGGIVVAASSTMAPRVTKVTDAQLTAALRRQSRRHPSTLVENSRLIGFVWVCAAVVQGQSAYPFQAQGGTQDVLGIAHHCSCQVLLWMRGQQRRKAEQRNHHLVNRHQPLGVAGDSSSVTSEGETKLGICELRYLIVCTSKDWPVKAKPGAFACCCVTTG